MARPWNKIWMPSTVFKLTGSKGQIGDPNRSQYVFQVPPSTTKLEIKDYLQKIYGLDVKKVTTVNYDGKVKRRNGKLYKRPAYKRATVILQTPKAELETTEADSKVVGN